VLRQQHPSPDGYCYALSDFLDEKNDKIGVFAVTVAGGEEAAAAMEKADDIYNALLLRTLTDRLAEASAEYLHWLTRTKFWGYAPKETFDPERLLRCRYQGIRPAVGYPSLPDQSLIFELDRLIHFEKLGVRLTENGAMSPTATVAGLYFAHPEARYFSVGKIDAEQLADYAHRRKKTQEEMRKFLAANL